MFTLSIETLFLEEKSMTDDMMDIAKKLLALNKANMTADEIQYLDPKDFSSDCSPLVHVINDSIEACEKKRLADRKRIRRDIERRVRAERSHDIEETLEGARMGIWALEIEDGCPPRMYVDTTMRMLLGIENKGFSPEETYEAWFSNIVSGYVDMVEESVSEMEQGRQTEVVYPWKHPKIGQIYIRCGGLRDNFDRPGFRLKGYHQDITDTMVMRQRQEKAMFEAIVEAKKANAAKTEFISNMSHDIRTPINGILGMLMIAEKNGGNLAKQMECRAKIRMAAEHLLSLINDVLDISKIESGTLAIAEEPFNIHELVDNSMSIVGPQSEELGVSLERDWSEIAHPDLMGSPLHLRQILINIIGNGIKYNKNGGKVSIHTEELSCNGSTANYRFMIEDNGIGMSEEFMKHLFEPFTQEGKDARTNYRGTGLGMAITKGLIEQMGGTINVKSQAGAGTRICVELPFKVGKSNSAKSGDEKGTTDISGMRLLLAEDNDLNREIAEYMLRDAGAEVINAVNGSEAVKLFERETKGGNKIDCILMDIMMPIMDGLEATKAIRLSRLPRATTVPIIAMSANAFTEDSQKARDVGMNAYLTKPLDVDKMMRVIASYRLK